MHKIIIRTSYLSDFKAHLPVPALPMPGHQSPTPQFPTLQPGLNQENMLPKIAMVAPKERFLRFADKWQAPSLWHSLPITKRHTLGTKYFDSRVLFVYFDKYKSAQRNNVVLSIWRRQAPSLWHPWSTNDWHITDVEDFNFRALQTSRCRDPRDTRVFVRVAHRGTMSQASGTHDPSPNGTPRN